MTESSKPPSKLTEFPATERTSPERFKMAWMAVWMDRTQRRFEQELTPIRAADTKEDWSEIYDRIGPDLFQATLREGFLQWEFFPKPKRILELSEVIRQELCPAPIPPEMQLYVAPQQEAISPEERKELWAKVKAVAAVKTIP